MNIYVLYPLLSFLLFSLPLALIEISVEKAHGWGSGWSKDKWYAKSIFKGTKTGDILTKITKLEPPLNYHIIVAYIIYPGVFVLEYIFLTKNIFLVLSSFFIAILFGDIAWFVFNWYFDSWTQLTKGPNGSIFWHKKWTKISKNRYLPTAYFNWFFWAVIFFILALIFSK